VTLALRVGLAIGGAIDLYVGVLALFAPQLFPSLLDIPMRDPVLAAFGGGEMLVVTLAYVLALRDPRRNRILLWVCALDQLVAVVMPSLAIAHGVIPASWKTVGPIPLQAALCVLFVAGARRRVPRG
jgi:hypothetical protein